MRGADASASNAVQTELARQVAILRHWRVDRDLPHFEEGASLIGGLGAEPCIRQRESFAALEELSAAAVPAVVALMDDRRPLVEQQISLVNGARDAFEDIRHYGPEQVVDALAAILNQISGASFGFIYNGGPDSQRRAVADTRRVYAADLPCAPGGTD
jgi:hypothetical protein